MKVLVLGIRSFHLSSTYGLGSLSPPFRSPPPPLRDRALPWIQATDFDRPTRMVERKSKEPPSPSP